MTDTTPTFKPGDRIRTLPTDDGETPAGSLGTITDHFPPTGPLGEGYGVRLDDDPTGLPAHYDPHEIEPAPTTDADLHEAVATAVYRHMPTASEQPASTAHRITADVLEVVDGLERQRAALEADRVRILQIVSDWATRCAEYGGEDAGDLIWDLEQAGYHLPAEETTEETDRG